MCAKLNLQMESLNLSIDGEDSTVQNVAHDFFQLVSGRLSNFSSLSQPAKENLKIEATPIHEDEIYSETSLASFLTEKNFTTDVDLVLGVAYYLEHKEKRFPFTSKEITVALAEAKWAEPKNVSLCINRNIKKGFLRQEKEKKGNSTCYSVLNYGKQRCETFSSSRATNKKSKELKRKTNNNQANNPLLEISLNDLNLNNYPKIESLPSAVDKILLLFYIYLMEKKIEKFSKQDIFALLKHKFKTPLTLRQIRYALENTGGTNFDRQLEGNKTQYSLTSYGIEAAKLLSSDTSQTTKE